MAQVYPHLHIVLLADDFGEKLWPLARKQAPACLVPVDSGARDSLLAAVVARTRPFSSYPVHVVTTAQLAASIDEELTTFCGLAAGDIDTIIVPAQHGTAFSVALACACIRREDPDAVCMVVPANQRMETDDRWDNLVFTAYQVALRDSIVLFGSAQEQRCAGVSYMRHGGQYENIEGTYEVRLFVSDARLSTAQRAIRDGALWYTGMFMARAASVLGALASAGGEAGSDGGFGVERIAETAGFLALLERRAWCTDDAKSIISVLPDTTIEKAAFERSRRLVALPVTAPVKLVSALADLDDADASDAAGNCGYGSVVQLDTTNTTVFEQEPGRLVCVSGVDNVMVIDTADAVLVAAKPTLRDMQPLFSALAGAGAPQLETSVRRPFSWGTATLLFKVDGSATWRLDVRANVTLRTLWLAGAYGCAEGRVAREQYAVAAGDVTLGQSTDALSMTAGDAFEVDADDPFVVVSGNAGATLVLTAALG